MIDLNVLLCMALAVLAYMNVMFLLAIAMKRNDIVDIAWGLGFIIVALLSLVAIPGITWRRLLVSGLVIAWGLRLAGYLYLRNRGRKEDFRYAQWRQQWGGNWMLRSYLQVFILQGLLMLMITYPLFTVTQSRIVDIGILDGIGILVWLVGFLFEAIGDAQMRAFKQDPANRGKIMDRGLWRYTRHPNYFGESAMWWGIWIILMSNSHGIYAIFSPIIITFLLLRVSGVPMLEKKYRDDPAYREYVRRTSAFIPLPPSR